MQVPLQINVAIGDNFAAVSLHWPVYMINLYVTCYYKAVPHADLPCLRFVIPSGRSLCVSLTIMSDVK